MTESDDKQKISSPSRWSVRSDPTLSSSQQTCRGSAPEPDKTETQCYHHVLTLNKNNKTSWTFSIFSGQYFIRFTKFIC